MTALNLFPKYAPTPLSPSQSTVSNHDLIVVPIAVPKAVKSVVVRNEFAPPIIAFIPFPTVCPNTDQSYSFTNPFMRFPKSVPKPLAHGVKVSVIQVFALSVRIFNLLANNLPIPDQSPFSSNVLRSESKSTFSNIEV